MTGKEFRTFMANLAIEQDRRQAQLEAKLAESRTQLEARLAESRAKSAESLDQLEARLAESRTQLEARLAESRTQSEAQLAEFRKQLEAKLVESHTRLETQLAQTDAQLAKTDAQLAKTDAQLNKLSKLFGEVNNNRGEVAEEFFFRSLKKHLQIGSVKFDVVHRNLHGEKGKIHDEFDLILTNGDALALIEIKTKAHTKLVTEMLNKKIPNLRILFPHFKDYKIYAGIASLVSYEELVNQTAENGLFLLTQQGKHLEITTENMRCF